MKQVFNDFDLSVVLMSLSHDTHNDDFCADDDPLYYPLGMCVKLWHATLIKEIIIYTSFAPNIFLSLGPRVEVTLISIDLLRCVASAKSTL